MNCVDCGSENTKDVREIAENDTDFMGYRPNGESVHEYECNDCYCRWCE